MDEIIKGKVIINYKDLSSIKKAEIKHNKLINKGFCVYETKQIGFDIFQNNYI